MYWMFRPRWHGIWIAALMGLVEYGGRANVYATTSITCASTDPQAMGASTSYIYLFISKRCARCNRYSLGMAVSLFLVTDRAEELRLRAL